MRRGRPYEIAIVGMGCRFPGAPDLSRFFENILGAKDGAREESTPSAARIGAAERWDAQWLPAPQWRANDRASSSQRGCHGSAIRVNADARGIMMRTVAAAVPEELMASDVTVSALADAGLTLDALEDLKAASFVVDASSGSSIAAVYLAARALLKKRINIAIAGGVSLTLDADPMVSAQSAGIVVLKRRSDAERDGDRIYSIIKSIGLARGVQNQWPAVRGVASSTRAMRRAYRGAGIDPATVSVIECSGLGVPGAQEAELRALDAVFPPLRHGHRILGAASPISIPDGSAEDMAGLIKSALALYHRALPPTLHAESLPAKLVSPSSTFALNPITRPWIHGDEEVPRRSGVNAFGFAGIDAHVVLEEHAPSADAGRPGALRTWETEAILLSGVDRADLVAQIHDILHWLKVDSRHTLLDLAYSLNSRREHPRNGARLGFVVSSLAELSQRFADVLPKLADPACRSIRDARGIYYWDEPLLNEGNAGLAFLFPGEGSQYPGMLADLCLHFPEVRILFDTADRIARDLGEAVPPSEHLFDPVAGSDEKLWATATAVNVVLNAQWALYQVLTRLGLHPSAVLGHSSGEILALSAGGVFTTDRELEHKLSRLGAIMKNLESSGELPEARLLAVATHRDRAEALCRDLNVEDVDIAMDNCPHQVVLAVPSSRLARVSERLRLENILFEELPFSRAYHTPSFLPVVGPIAEFFEQMSFRPPRVPIYSCASHARMPSSPDAIRQLAIAQWTQTVAFRETIEAMHSDGLRLFIDVGARGNLAGFVEDTLRGKPSFAIAANLPRRTGLTQLNHLVAATFAHGAALNTDYLYARRQPHAIDRFVSVQSLFEPTADDHAMLSFQATMQAFLQTQQAVMSAYFGVPTPDDSCSTSPGHGSETTTSVEPSGAEPGPWAGEIRRLVTGSEVETRLILEAHDDPVAHHHTLGGRKISALDPSLLGLPVLPFAVMAEMTTQAAALLVPPELVLTGLKAVRAHKWVRYEDEPVHLELRGHRIASPDDDRVWVGIFNRGTDGKAEAARPVFEAIAIFGERVSTPSQAEAWSPGNARPSKFTAQSVYAEQWLFHGPLFQAIAQVGELSDKGIEGRLKVLPLEGLVKGGPPATFHTDLVVIDNFTQLLGAWGLDFLAEGDVMFPLHLEELEIFGARPPVGSEVTCQIKINTLERHRIGVQAQFVRADGSLWMRIKDWEDWRFHWPGRYRDSFRQPRDYLVGEDLPLEVQGQAAPAGVKAVWLEPPADMGRPVWRDVLEFTQLGPRERAACYPVEAISESLRSQILWGRIAAKEAARRLWNDANDPPVYPADLMIVADEHGRPLLRHVGEPSLESPPAISIARADGVAVALAALDPTAHPGIAVEPIVDRASAIDQSPFTAGERGILERWTGASRAEWAARFWCAKQAAARAWVLESAGDPASVKIVKADQDTGVIDVWIDQDRVTPGPNQFCDQTVFVISARRGDRAWAWTIGKGIKP